MLDRDRGAWISRLADGRKPVTDSTVAGEHAPRIGDMVITRHVADRRVRYTICRFDRQPQISFDTRDKALALARAFVARARVELWECDRGRYTRLAPRGPARTPAHG